MVMVFVMNLKRQDVLIQQHVTMILQQLMMMVLVTSLLVQDVLIQQHVTMIHLLQ
jgi:hypothetical protein